MFVSLVGCGQENEMEGEVPSISIGQVFTDDDPNSGMANEAFRLALEAYIGIPVVEIEGVSYLVGVEAMRAGNLDIMFASAFNFVRAQEVVPVEILATLSNPEIEPAHTVFITHINREDINSIEDLRGQTFAFVDAASTSGYLFPKYHLVTNLNLDQNLVMQPGYFFSSAVFSGGHDSSLMGVNFGDFDGAAVVTTVLEMMFEAGVVSEEDIKIIGETEPAPDASYIIRSELPQEIIDDIRSFFLTFDDADYFKQAWGNSNVRFIEGDEEATRHVQSLMDTLEFNFE